MSDRLYVAMAERMEDLDQRFDDLGYERFDAQQLSERLSRAERHLSDLQQRVIALEARREDDRD